MPRSRLAAGVIVLTLVIHARPASQAPAAPQLRPGPDLLYRPAATSPQFENSGVWRAAPLMISGVAAYRSGEFLYQDYLYDDRGAGGRATYPDDRPKYAANSADFVEVRVKPLPAETAIRLTFNSMIDPGVAGATIALAGESAQTVEAPFGAHGRMPADLFVTVHGGAAELAGPDGRPIAGRAAATVDLARRQIDVRVPFTAFDPRNRTVRMTAATGIWDPTTNAFMIPAEAAARARGAGGGGGARGAAAPAATPATVPATNRAAYFNVAFRLKEPYSVGTLTFWRDTAQSAALATGDLSEFSTPIDFRRLAAGTTDDSALPRTGFITRILVSHFEPAQGRGATTGSLAPEACASPCVPEYAGRLQPYTYYVPAKTPPASGYGLTLDIHSANANYNRWLGHRRAIEFGERGTGSIVVTPNGRGVGAWYYSESEADVFEVWADLARLYRIDPDYVALAGVSMGGYGSWKLAAQFPDLFAAAALAVPCPAVGMPGGAAFDHSYVGEMAASFRHVPAIAFTGELDRTCRLEGAKGERETFAEYAKLGLRYDWYIFLTMPHAMSSTFPHYAPMVEFLGARKRPVDPRHVSYVYNTSMDQPTFGITANHAYWISNIVPRDASNVHASVDVVSHGSPVGDPVASKKNLTGTFDAGVANFPWPNYTREVLEWGAAPAAPVRNALDVSTRNVASLTIDPKRAKVTCDAAVKLDSDGQVTVRLLGCPSR